MTRPSPLGHAWLIASLTGTAAAIAYGLFFSRLAALVSGGSPRVGPAVASGLLFGVATLAFALSLETLRTARGAQWQGRLPVLRGARVRLRELRREDARPLLTLLAADPIAPVPPLPRTAAAARSFIAKARRTRAHGRGCCFAVVTPDDDRSLMGLIHFFQLPGSCRDLGWGFLFGHAYRRRGLFSEAASLALPFAFDTMRAPELHAWVLAGNDRANRALGRLGATSTPVPAARVPDGRTGDFVCWTLTKAGGGPSPRLRAWTEALRA